MHSCHYHMFVAAADTKTEGGAVYRSAPQVKPDAIVTIDDENYVKILFGKLNPQRVMFILVLLYSLHLMRL